MATGGKKFIIDVVPLTRIPLTRGQSFCYIHNEELTPGTLVEIPLFRRSLEGVVAGSRCDFPRLGNIELKKIEKVIEKDFLTNEQIELAEFISEYYISPLGVVMKNFVPKRVKKRIGNFEFGILNEKIKKIILTKEQQSAVCAISDSKFKIQNSKFLLYGPAASGKTEVYIHSILKLREKNPDLQFLILVPEQTLTPQAVERYGAYFGSGEIVLLTSNVSKGQYWANWLKIHSGEVRIVIGTRMAVFAPYKKLGLVVIDEEQDMSYKQWDMNPRYDARTVAEKLVEIHKCPIVRGSATPGIESYFKANNGNYGLIKLPYFQNSKFKIQNSSAEVIDMKKERWQKNYSCISKKLKGEIAYALRNKLQTILLINRQGMSSFSVCDLCKAVLKCPQCDRALVYDNSGIYRCTHCAYKTPIVPKCSQCGSIKFKNVGLGTQKVEREVQDLFPGARIARLDSQSIRTKDYQEKIYKEFSGGGIDIIVGTQMISKGWDLPRVALVGIIDTDNMLSIPDFSAAERAFQNIAQVSGRVARPGARFPGTVVIQSFQPENPIIKLSAARDFDGFYKYELEERRPFLYPPFGRLIKLVCQDLTKDKARKEAERAYGELIKIAKIKVSEPQEAFISKIRGRYRIQIVIKIPDKVMPKKLITILQALSAGWVVDVEPVSII